VAVVAINLWADCPELVGRWPYGSTWTVAVVGDHAYFGSGAALRIADVSDPSSPRIIGDVMLPGLVRGVAASEEYAYIAADANAGLRVIDVRTPWDAVEVGFHDTPGSADDVAVWGTFAFVADGAAGLRVIDVSAPASPVEVGSYDTAGYAFGVAVRDGYAYVADYAQGLRVIHVDPPANPVEVGFYDTPGYAIDVFLYESLGKVLACVADEQGGLRVIDVSTPAAPIEVGFIDSRGSPRAVSVGGDYAYVTVGWDGGLRIIDVSTPALPVEVGFYDTPGSAWGVAVSGSHAYVADEDHGLRVIDVSAPSAPVEVNSFDTPFYTGAVVASGEYAYLADGRRGFRVLDVSTPSIPVEVGYAPLAPSVGVGVSGQRAYLASCWNGLRVIDVSAPASPIQIGERDTPGCASDVEIQGPYAYVADLYDGLRVIDVTSSSLPVEVGYFDTPGPALGVALSGPFAYVAEGEMGLRLIDISTPSTPEEVAVCDTPGNARDVAVSWPYAYVADNYSGLRVIDVSLPLAPMEVGFFDTAGASVAVAVVGPHAYVADSSTGLRVIDVSVPTAPIEVGYHRTPFDSVDVSTSGGFVYVAEGHSGMEILRTCSFNEPPVLAPVGEWTVAESDTLEFQLSATDDDGDVLTYLMGPGTVPPGATLDPASGYFSYTPGYDVSTPDANTAFDVVFRVDDGVSGSSAQTSQITVLDVTGGTPPGVDVTVEPIDPETGTSPVSITFSEVLEGGETSVTTTRTGPPPDTGFRLANNNSIDNPYIQIETNATYVPPIHLCFDYSSYRINGDQETRLRVFHLVLAGGFKNDGTQCTESNGCWDDITDPDLPDNPNPDTASDVICGTSNSLSLFAIVEAIEISAPLDPVAVNTEILASFNLGDSETVEGGLWTWGDGTQSAATLSNGVVAGTHSYSSAGIYIPVLTLWYDGREVGSADFKYLVVYDPNGGFVTGGGWINSPAGAYPDDPTLTGKANFGFVAKYVQGAQKPVGTTEFRFNAAGLNFQSSSYQWLVVAGAQAKYKGVGTVNGVDGYGFMISAIDGALPGGGGQDKFRMKIWEVSTEELIYDNQLDAPEDAEPTTILGGGSIVIHRS